MVYKRMKFSGGKVINRILLGGYGYARVTGPSSGATAAIPGTPPLPAPHHHQQPPPPPPSTSAQQPPTQAPPPPPHDATDPRQYTSPMPPPARPPSAMSKLDNTTSPHPPHSATPTTTAPASLCEIDPQSVPANMKMEGQDWFALYVSCPLL